MDHQGKNEFFSSLDLLDPEIEPFLPYILQDLWELGSMPVYMIRLFEKHLTGHKIKRVIDLGCGKGAVLIKLAGNFPLMGRGIDLMPDFIQVANAQALQHQVSHRLTFEESDLKEEVKTLHDQDLIIYGNDSEVLGNLETTLRHLKKCLSTPGWILLETVHQSDQKAVVLDSVLTTSETLQQISNANLTIVDMLQWENEMLRSVNESNTKNIRQRIAQLTIKYPEKNRLFQRYLDHQIQECYLLENELTCTTWLLEKKFMD